MTADSVTRRSNDSSPAGETPRKFPWWRWGCRFLCYGLPILAVVAYFLPAIVSSYLLRGETLAWLNSNLGAQFEIGHASLGWQSPVLLNDVRVRGDDGQELATVSAVTSRQSLWELLYDQSRPFEFELDGLRSSIVVKELAPASGRIEIAQLLENLMRQTLPRPNRPMTVTIVNGRFDLRDRHGRILTRWQPITATYRYERRPIPPADLRADRGDPNGSKAQTGLAATSFVSASQSLTLQAPVLSRNREPGELNLEAFWTITPQQVHRETLTVDVTWRRQPLDALRPWISRYLDLDDDIDIPTSNGQLQGRLTRERDRSLNLELDGDFFPAGPQREMSTVPTSTDWGGDLIGDPDFNGIRVANAVHLVSTYDPQHEYDNPSHQNSMRSRNGDATASGPPSVPMAEPLNRVAFEAGVSPDADPFQVRIQANYSRPDDRLDVPRVYAAGDRFLLDVAGSISDLSRSESLALSGRLETDGDVLAELIPELIPEGMRWDVHLEDLHISEISIHGPLRAGAADDGGPVAVRVSTVVEWGKVSAYEFHSEDGSVRVVLDDRQLHLEPVDVIVNGGRLRQLPAFDLAGAPVARLDSGPVFHQVGLNEEMCRTWLKFASPALAHATSAEGRLSLSVDESRFDLHTFPSRMEEEMTGKLTIHDARVSAGPLAASIIQQVNRLRSLVNREPWDPHGRTWLSIGEQPVDFRIADGRVHHEHFAFVAGGMPVFTRGSVGLEDESLDLTVALVIPERWVADAGPVLRTLQGERIELAVGGTLEEPRIDGAPLAELGKRLGTRAAGSLLQQLLERRINNGK